MSEQTKEEITYRANWLIQVHSKKWLHDSVGITIHTINRRLVEGDWKKAEEFIINSLYEKAKKRGGGNDAEG